MLKSIKLKRFLLGSIVPVVILLLWQLLVEFEYINPLLFPAPSSIFVDLYHMVQSGELFFHLRISVVRAMAGFAIGSLLGLVVGICVGLFKKSEYMLDPTIQMLRTVPLLAITPLFILWFGFGELSKILLISMGAFFPLYVNSFLGVRNVDSKLFDVARVLEFSRLHQITKSSFACSNAKYFIRNAFVFKYILVMSSCSGINGSRSRNWLSYSGC